MKTEVKNFHILMRPLNLSDFEQVNEVKYDSTRRFGKDYRSLALTEKEFGSFVDAGLAYGISSDEKLLAICYASEQGGDIYIEFVGVRQEASGHKLGFKFLDHFCQIARQRNKRRLSLITSGKASWNKPYYQKYGFSLINEAEICKYDYLNERIISQNKFFAGIDLLLPRIAMSFNV